MCKRYRGTTLVELIAIFSIIAILITTAVPAFTQFLLRHKAGSMSQKIFSRLTMARGIAINRRQWVTVCGSRGDGSCTGQTMKFLIVFEDKNQNHQLDLDETMHQRIELGTEPRQLSLKAGFGKSHIEIDSHGRARQAGSFYYCPKNNDSRFAQRITINRAGRAYIARDGDGDGIVEKSDGSPITC